MRFFSLILYNSLDYYNAFEQNGFFSIINSFVGINNGLSSLVGINQDIVTQEDKSL